MDQTVRGKLLLLVIGVGYFRSSVWRNESLRPSCFFAYPPKQSQKSLRRQLGPIPLTGVFSKANENKSF